MSASESITTPTVDGTPPRSQATHRTRWPGWLIGGGIDGNEQLTSWTGLILIALFAVLGLTIVQIRQLIWLHLFLGLLLLGPVVLKLASTSYRFIRYYTRSAIYLAKGPPMLALRAMGPLLVLTTVIVFASGVVLFFVGPRDRSIPLAIHKVSFIVWGVLLGVHVLAHLPEMGRSLRAVRLGAAASGTSLERAGTGAAGRWLALAGALVGGVVLAVVLLPHFGLWTAPGAFPHHHHHG